MLPGWGNSLFLIFAFFKKFQYFCISFYSCRCSLVWWENSSFLIFVRLKPANPPILFLSARTNRNIHAAQFAKEISKITGVTLCKHFHRGVKFLSDPSHALSLRHWVTPLTPSFKFCSNCWIFQSCYIDFCKLFDGFVKVVTWISLRCKRDLSKLIRGFL